MQQCLHARNRTAAVVKALRLGEVPLLIGGEA